jgi:hypothetical protein
MGATIYDAKKADEAEAPLEFRFIFPAPDNSHACGAARAVHFQKNVG